LGILEQQFYYRRVCAAVSIVGYVAPGARATAETTFDVRFRNSSGVVVTKRFTSPVRAWIIV